MYLVDLTDLSKNKQPTTRDVKVCANVDNILISETLVLLCREVFKKHFQQTTFKKRKLRICGSFSLAGFLSVCDTKNGQREKTGHLNSSSILLPPTSSLFTPGFSLSSFWILLTQDLHVMPGMERVKFVSTEKA
jgi:hypothetical protein